MHKSDVISNLKTERNELINELEKRKSEFLAQQELVKI
jgi:hypothetical protein